MNDYDPNPPIPPAPPVAQGYLVPHRGSLILVLGILALMIFQPLGIAAWIMGNTDLKAIDEGRMDPEGRGMTLAGKVCGMIATILMLIGCIGGCLFFTFFAGLMGLAGAGAAAGGP